MSNREYKTAFEIKLKNAKKGAAPVTIHEPIGADGRILSESAKHTKVNSRLAQWKIKVPAEGETKLTYRTIVKY
ncbi:MAG: hypothetical protein OR997_03635 [Methylophilaceae bacterium]|mgnify:CR=1 FL=1|nr:hypothetical protein [Methylophilaceae bacterium]